MRPVALEPLFAADRTGAVETLQALATARLAFREDLAVFGARVGLDPNLLQVWVSLGLVGSGMAVVDATRGEFAEVVALTAKGARELTRATGQVVKGQSASRLKGRAKTRHDATVGGVALAILAAAREERLGLQALTTDDKTLCTSGLIREGNEVTRVPLQADGYALTHDGVTHRGLLLEIDMDQTGANRLASKFAAYSSWGMNSGPQNTFGLRSLRVITLVPSEKRLEKLRQVALEAVGRPSGMFLFALTSDVSVKEPSKLFEPIAKTLSGSMEPLFSRTDGMAATGAGPLPRPVRDEGVIALPAISLASAHDHTVSSPDRCSSTPRGTP